MKINVTVDLEDFYTSDEEMSFSDSIKENIAWSVKDQISKDFIAKMTTSFTESIQRKVEDEKEKLVDETFSKLIIDAKVKKRYSTNEMISISDYITEEITRLNVNDSKLNDLIAKNTRLVAESLANEFKTRYDVLFATQIVNKLHENGLLKEDAAKLLLTN
jgi:hypothetical protein